MGGRVHKHGALVHDGVAVTLDPILRRNLVVLDTGGRQGGVDDDIALVSVGRHALSHDVLVELRGLLVREAARNRAYAGTDDCANRSADDRSADRAGRGGADSVRITRDNMAATWSALNEGPREVDLVA